MDPDCRPLHKAQRSQFCECQLVSMKINACIYPSIHPSIFFKHLFIISSPLFESTVEKQQESWGRKKGNRTRLEFNPDHYQFNRSSCQGHQTTLCVAHLVGPSSFNVWIMTLKSNTHLQKSTPWTVFANQFISIIWSKWNWIFINKSFYEKHLFIFLLCCLLLFSLFKW